LNNIIWNNQSFTWRLTPATPTGPETTSLTAAGVRDLGIVGSATALASSNSVLTAGTSLANCSSCRSATAAEVAFVKRTSFAPQTDSDQPVVLPETTIMQTALTFDEGGNFINVNFSPLTPWDLANPAMLRADYHLNASALPASVAVNGGANANGTNRVPGSDYDNEVRAGGVDIGADEANALPVLPPNRPTFAAPLDNFNRANATTLGSNWQQLATLNNSGVRVNSNQAFCTNSGLSAVLCAAGANAYWNGTGAIFGGQQAAVFTFASTTLNNTSLYLKASGTFNALGAYPNAIRVRYLTGGGGQVVVETASNNGLTFLNVGTLSGVFINGDTMTALVDTNGLVSVWKTTATNTTTLLGSVSTGVTGTGRIGLFLPSGGRVDNFAGGTVP
jgi:hypothetical protein